MALHYEILKYDDIDKYANHILTDDMPFVLSFRTFSVVSSRNVQNTNTVYDVIVFNHDDHLLGSFSFDTYDAYLQWLKDEYRKREDKTQ